MLSGSVSSIADILLFNFLNNYITFIFKIITVYRQFVKSFFVKIMVLLLGMGKVYVIK